MSPARAICSGATPPATVAGRRSPTARHQADRSLGASWPSGHRTRRHRRCTLRSRRPARSSVVRCGLAVLRAPALYVAVSPSCGLRPAGRPRNSIREGRRWSQACRYADDFTFGRRLAPARRRRPTRRDQPWRPRVLFILRSDNANRQKSATVASTPLNGSDPSRGSTVGGLSRRHSRSHPHPLPGGLSAWEDIRGPCGPWRNMAASRCAPDHARCRLPRGARMGPSLSCTLRVAS
jgi:hypothetical protein